MEYCFNDKFIKIFFLFHLAFVNISIIYFVKFIFEYFIYYEWGKEKNRFSQFVQQKDP